MRKLKVEQLESRRLLAIGGVPNAWHNIDLPLDTSGDGQVTAIDALLCINHLNQHIPSQLPAERPPDSARIDVNRDGFATALDALLVVNQVNRNADPLQVYEPFEGPANQQLLHDGSGSGFLGLWRPGGFKAKRHRDLTYTDESLQYGNLESSGGAVSTPATMQISGLERDLLRPLGKDDTTHYFSFLLQPHDTSHWFGISLETQMGPELFVGYNQATPQAWSIENLGGKRRHISQEPVSLNETTLIVVKADFQAGIDQFTMYVNPTSLSELGPGITKTDTDFESIYGIGIYSRGGFTIDEFRLGTTLAAVLPGLEFS